MAATDNANQVFEDPIITIDRRRGDRRQNEDAPGQDVADSGRRKKQRRRHIDPTTCERDYTNDEIEFMRAMDEYKNRSGRMFPTCSEVLEVVRELGYVKLSDTQRDVLDLEAPFAFDAVESTDSDDAELDLDAADDSDLDA